MRLNYDLKRPYIETMFEMADKYNLKMFVSDAHHKEKSHSAGCCGLPDTRPLSNINRGQYAEAILIAKKKGRVYWGDIAKIAEWLKEIPFGNAEGFNTSGTEERVHRMYQTMFDYMHDCWNNTKSALSPVRYFGGALVPARETDAAGDLVYLYNEPYIARGERVSSVLDLQNQLTERGFQLQADGQIYGHVAFPIFVIADNATPLGKKTELLRSLEQNKLNYRVFVDQGLGEQFSEFFPQADVVELLTETPVLEAVQTATLEGLTNVWLLETNQLQKIGRAELSDLEARHSENPFIEFPVGAKIVQCAQPEPML